MNISDGFDFWLGKVMAEAVIFLSIAGVLVAGLFGLVVYAKVTAWFKRKARK